MKVARASGPQSPVASVPPPGRQAARSRSFLEVFQEGASRPESAPRAAPSAPAAPPKGPSGAAPPSPLARGVARALESAAAGEARVDAILDAAARGKTFTPAQLLGMQATVFRYSQTIEVFSRATDRLVGALKQTLGTQV